MQILEKNFVLPDGQIDKFCKRLFKYLEGLQISVFLPVLVMPSEMLSVLRVRLAFSTCGPNLIEKEGQLWLAIPGGEGVPAKEMKIVISNLIGGKSIRVLYSG